MGLRIARMATTEGRNVAMVGHGCGAISIRSPFENSPRG